MYTKHAPEQYRTTIAQVIKICKLKTFQKFKEEINFTETQNTQLQKKQKETQMGILEPALTIAKKLQHGVDEETSFLLIKNQQQLPFIKQFSVELELVNA